MYKELRKNLKRFDQTTDEEIDNEQLKKMQKHIKANRLLLLAFAFVKTNGSRFFILKT